MIVECRLEAVNREGDAVVSAYYPHKEFTIIVPMDLLRPLGIRLHEEFLIEEFGEYLEIKRKPENMPARRPSSAVVH